MKLPDMECLGSRKIIGACLYCFQVAIVHNKFLLSERLISCVVARIMF